MSGQWPPGWEDQEEESPEGTGQTDTEAEARLAEVAAYLASVPVPVMPDAVETRIDAALAAEAAGSRALGPAPARARVRRHSVRGHRDRVGRDRVGRDSGGRRSRRDLLLRRPVAAVGSLVVCLLLAGLGFALSRGGPGPSPAAAPAAGTSSSVAARASAAESSVAGSSGAGSSAAAAAPAPRASSREPLNAAGSASSFLVSASGTKYQRATLAGQARARSASSASAGAAVGAAPSAALRGCVLHLTGGALPRLVDRATYQGEPAYVVVSATRVWVVGLGCTAAKTELIVSVALAGLPGNLRALVSVEQ